VREVARLHGGEVELRNLEKGGAVATLRLPMT
jgi:two-component system sensor histidine kinase CreC